MQLVAYLWWIGSMHHSYNYYGERSFHIFLRSLYKTILSINFKPSFNDLIGDLFSYRTWKRTQVQPNQGRLSPCFDQIKGFSQASQEALKKVDCGGLSTFSASLSFFNEGVIKSTFEWNINIWCVFIQLNYFDWWEENRYINNNYFKIMSPIYLVGTYLLEYL